MTECIRRPHSVWTTCPCPPCRADAARMAKLSRNGQYRRVPSEAAWVEIDRLRRLEWSSHAIATAARLPHATLQNALTTLSVDGHKVRFGPRAAAAIVGHGDPTDGEVGVTGTRRRLQGLARHGWDLHTLADWTGIGFSTLAALRMPGTRRCRAIYYVAIRDLVADIEMRPGPSRGARQHAERLDWPGLLAWDGDRIDDPSGAPYIHNTVDDDAPDEAVVLRALSGERIDTSRAERFEIMRRWLAAGRSERELCCRMGWREGRYSPRGVGAPAHSRQGDERKVG